MVWNALQLAVADAEVDPSVALDLVVAAVPVEDIDTVLAAVLTWTLSTLTAVYLPDGRRREAVARVADVTTAALAASSPGSGRQLAAARGLIATGSDLALLRRWLGGTVPDGLVLDADLRWRILAQLCAAGDSDAAEIGRELAADDSTEGAQQAARCRAALPDPQAKQQAWSVLMTDADGANSLLYATARGFWHPDQAGLTAPYVPRYFAEIADTGALRSGWVVGRVAALAYPWIAISPATLRATEQLAARPDLVAGIRRAVIDQGDDLRRALVSRKRFDPSAT